MGGGGYHNTLCLQCSASRPRRPDIPHVGDLPHGHRLLRVSAACGCGGVAPGTLLSGWRPGPHWPWPVSSVVHPLGIPWTQGGRQSGVGQGERLASVGHGLWQSDLPVPAGPLRVAPFDPRWDPVIAMPAGTGVLGRIGLRKQYPCPPAESEPALQPKPVFGLSPGPKGSQSLATFVYTAPPPDTPMSARCGTCCRTRDLSLIRRSSTS